MLKRLFDLVCAGLALVVLSPVLVFVAIAVKCGDGGPVLYQGVRIGQHGRPFRMLKFRTMVVNAERIGASSTPNDDPRVTPVGRSLRKFKLDELPQLINVLMGEMSLVGPRPQVPWAVELYTESEKMLLSVRPGITDYASLMFRNEAQILDGSLDPDRDYLDKVAPKKIQLGLAYIKRQSLREDVKIIVATVLALVGLGPQWAIPDVRDGSAQEAA
jgi:lipopolysaccharide/colanic/teichoic acid biosynthesis glycosyltransferase